MSKLTKKDVTHVATLSNLDLTDKEIEKFLPQLSNIIDYIGKLSEVDTKNIKPTTQVTDLSNIYRKNDFSDISNEEALTQSETLSNTDSYNGFFKVPAILKRRTNKWIYP